MNKINFPKATRNSDYDARQSLLTVKKLNSFENSTPSRRVQGMIDRRGFLHLFLTMRKQIQRRVYSLPLFNG